MISYDWKPQLGKERGHSFPFRIISQYIYFVISFLHLFVEITCVNVRFGTKSYEQRSPCFLFFKKGSEDCLNTVIHDLVKTL